MSKCRQTKATERWFDEGCIDTDARAEHVSVCAECSAIVAQLERIREAMTVTALAPEIADAQMPAFMNELNERLSRRRSVDVARWRVAFSMGLAALLVAVSLLFLFDEGPKPVAAKSTIEACDTDLEGAEATSYSSDDGSVAVWVTPIGEDIWQP